MKRALTSNPAHVVVGVQGDADARDGEGIGNVRLASVHEFGAGNVPERSFLRSTVREHREKYTAILDKVTRGVADGKIDMLQGLALLGEKVASDVKRRIEADKLGVPLADATIARKGSSVPLIDTGQLKNSITYEVRRGKTPREDDT